MSDKEVEIPVRQGVGLSYFFLIAGVLAGFLFAWWLNDNPEVRYAAMFVSFGVLVALSKARNFWLKYESAKLEIEYETAKLNVSSEKSEEKAAKTVFDSNDFAEDARALLLKPVKEARKKGIPVTGHGLINIILKGIR
jgi:hypothetical protein